MSTATDFTSSGVKIEGVFENDRNAEGADLFKAILREAYGVTDVIIGQLAEHCFPDQKAFFISHLGECWIDEVAP